MAAQEQKKLAKGMSNSKDTEDDTDTPGVEEGQQADIRAQACATKSPCETKDSAAKSGEATTVSMPKKLSKLQQLAKDKAEAKRIAQNAYPKSSVAAPLVSSLAKLRNNSRELKDNAPGHFQNTALPCTPRPREEASEIASAKVSDEEVEQGSTEWTERLSKVTIAAPSAFAHVVLGVSASTESTLKTADRVFSCFVAASNSQLSKAQKSFTDPSPDDAVRHAQSSSKGKF